MSREHIFGDKLAELLSTVQRPVPVRARIKDKTGNVVIAQGGGRSILNEVSVCLCRCCNTDFSDMMGKAQPLLFSLAKGERQDLGTEDKAALLRYFERLGFLVDVLASDYELSEATRNSPHFKSGEWRDFPPVYSLAERSCWLRGKRTGEEPMIWLGRHTGVLGLNPETSVDAYAILTSSGMGVHRRFHTVIRELAVEIQFRGPAREPYNELGAYVRLDSSATPLSWPPLRTVEYEDFFKLRQQSQYVQESRALYRDPISCVMQEFHVREATAL